MPYGFRAYGQYVIARGLGVEAGVLDVADDADDLVLAGRPRTMRTRLPIGSSSGPVLSRHRLVDDDAALARRRHRCR